MASATASEFATPTASRNAVRWTPNQKSATASTITAMGRSTPPTHSSASPGILIRTEMATALAPVAANVKPPAPTMNPWVVTVMTPTSASTRELKRSATSSTMTVMAIQTSPFPTAAKLCTTTATAMASATPPLPIAAVRRLPSGPRPLTTATMPIPIPSRTQKSSVMVRTITVTASWTKKTVWAASPTISTRTRTATASPTS